MRNIMFYDGRALLHYIWKTYLARKSLRLYPTLFDEGTSCSQSQLATRALKHDEDNDESVRRWFYGEDVKE